MTGETLKAAAITLYGKTRHTSRLAAALGIGRHQVWRYFTGRSPIPRPVEIVVNGLMEKQKG